MKRIDMRCLAVILTLVAMFTGLTGCVVTYDPKIVAAAEAIVDAGGTFHPVGSSLAVKDRAGIPKRGFAIQSVSMNGAQVGDEQVEFLQYLKDLEELHLQNTSVTDAGLARLGGLKKLRVLDLHRSQKFTDSGLVPLSGLSGLVKLELSYSRVTDAGIDQLLLLKRLQTVHLIGTRVTAEGVKKLKDSLPRCEIFK